MVLPHESDLSFPLIPLNTFLLSYSPSFSLFLSVSLCFSPFFQKYFPHILSFSLTPSSIQFNPLPSFQSLISHPFPPFDPNLTSSILSLFHGGFAIETASPKAPWLQGSQHHRHLLLLRLHRHPPSSTSPSQTSSPFLLQTQETQTQLLQNMLLHFLLPHPLPHRCCRPRPRSLLPTLRPKTPRLPPPRFPDLVLQSLHHTGRVVPRLASVDSSGIQESK